MAEHMESDLHDVVAESVLFAPFGPTPSEKWEALTSDDAAFARAAARRAQQIKMLFGEIASLLYQEGVADLAIYRQRLAEAESFKPADDLAAGM